MVYKVKYSTEQLSDINQNYNNSVGSSSITKVYSNISQLPYCNNRLYANLKLMSKYVVYRLFCCTFQAGYKTE